MKPANKTTDNNTSVNTHFSKVKLNTVTELLGLNIVNEVKQQLKKPLRYNNLTMNQWLVLKALYLKRANNPSEIAHSINIETASVSRSCEVLAQRNLIEREHQMDDRRMVRLYLTPEGIKVAKHINACYAEVFNGFEQRLSKEDLELWSKVEQCIAAHVNTR